MIYVPHRAWRNLGLDADGRFQFEDVSSELSFGFPMNGMGLSLADVDGDLAPDFLGFTSKQCGTHSVRSSGAMWMHLAGVPSYSIMMIGRWSSDAFLLYIRRAVQEFSGGIGEGG